MSINIDQKVAEVLSVSSHNIGNHTFFPVHPLTSSVLTEDNYFIIPIDAVKGT